jgi:hypothetical protein
MNALSARAQLASEAQPLPKIWVGGLLGIVYLVLELLLGLLLFNSAGQPGSSAAVLWVSGAGTAIGFSIWFYWLYCVFKLHDAVGSIPGYRHSITPASAVAWHFLPFYNIYWVFKWPNALADFVNWRMQRKKMRGWIAGVMVLAAVIIFRYSDGFVGAMLLFGSGWYISNQLRQAFAAPPIPESAMGSPVSTQILDL